MTKDIVASFDPSRDSIGNLMAVVFPKSKSFAYPLSVSIAKSAYRYNEKIIGNKLFHMALFSITKDETNKALALLNNLMGLKGFSIFMNGNNCKNPYSVYEVLQCYFKAINCTDYRAHCQIVIDDPFRETYRGSSGISFSIQLTDKPQESVNPIIIQRYLFPCKHLHAYFRFQKGHPSTPQDQIQAAAVERYCEWCPFFHPKEFTKLPTTVVWPNGTVITEPPLMSGGS